MVLNLSDRLMVYKQRLSEVFNSVVMESDGGQNNNNEEEDEEKEE